MSSLTERRIRNIESPPTGQLELREGRVEGLTLIVRASGGKTWRLRYRFRGLPKGIVLGKYPALDVTAARSLALEALRKVHAGRDPAQERKDEIERAQTDLFKDVARRFLDDHCVHNRTEVRQGADLGFRLNTVGPRHPDLDVRWQIIPGSIAARWADRNIATITKADVAKALEGVVKRARERQGGRGVSSSNRALAILSKFYGWAIDTKGIIPGPNPCRGIAKGKETSRDRVLTDEELKAIWYGASCLRYPFGPMFKLMALLGQRRLEIARMRRSEIKEDVWHLPASRVKNAQAAIVPLPALARVIIAQIPGDTDLLFTTNNGRSNSSGFSKAKKALDSAADFFGEVEPWTLHDARRTLASKLAEARVPSDIVELILNHRSEATSGVAGVYNRYQYLNERREALEKWSRIIMRIAPMQPEIRATVAEQELAIATTLEAEGVDGEMV